MARAAHKVETNWREADAEALEERVISLNEWLEHTEDMIEMLEGDKEIVTNSRSLCGMIRASRDNLAQEAARLRDKIS